MSQPVREPISVYGLVNETLPIVQMHSDNLGSFSVTVEKHREKRRIVIHSDYIDPEIFEFVDGFGTTWHLTK